MKKGLMGTAVFLLALVPFLLQQAPILADVSKSQFLEKYEPVAKKLQAFYRSVTIRATSTKTNWPAYEDTGGKRIEKLIFRGNGDLMRVDATVLSDDGRSAPSDTTIRVATPERCFLASRKAGQKPFVLRNVDTDYRRRAEAMCARYLLPSATYGYCELTIADFIRSHDITLTAVEELTREDEPMARVSFELNSKGIGWFLFSTERSWALREYLLEIKDKASPDYYAVRAVIEYDDGRDGMPRMKEARYWREKGREGERILNHTIVVDEFIVGPVPEEEFTLTALGIADIREQSRLTRALVFSFLGIVILIAAWFLVRHWTERRDMAQHG